MWAPLPFLALARSRTYCCNGPLVSFTEELMIHATATARSVPPHAAFPAGRPGAAETALLPVCIRNTALPDTAREAVPVATSAVTRRKVGVALFTVAMLGSLAYWTFGRSLFVVGSGSAEPEATPQPGRGTDWAAVDAELRKSVG